MVICPIKKKSKANSEGQVWWGGGGQNTDGGPTELSHYSYEIAQTTGSVTLTFHSFPLSFFLLLSCSYYVQKK